MEIRRILYIEDDIFKLMNVSRLLQSLGVCVIDSANNAEKGIEMAEKVHLTGEDYDLIMLDMHFNFYGVDDRKAGEKTMCLLRERGINTPVVFCSSQNWNIPGAVGSIFYNERREWESEAKELFMKLSNR